MLERHHFTDPVESSLLDFPSLLNRETESSSGVGEAARVAVREPHPQLHNAPFDLRQAPQHPLEGACQFGDPVLLVRPVSPATWWSTTLPGCFPATTARRTALSALPGTGRVWGLLW